MTAELKQLVDDKLEQSYVLAEAHFKRKFTRPLVLYKLTGQVAGYASWKHNRINLNFILLRDNVEDFIERTVPHEVAHLITDAVFGNRLRTTRTGRRRIHGKEWKFVMRVLGIEDETVCHSYDLSKSVTLNIRKFEYKCSCTTYLLGVCRHRKTLQGEGDYFCRKCHEDLTFVRQVSGARYG